MPQIKRSEEVKKSPDLVQAFKRQIQLAEKRLIDNGADIKNGGRWKQYIEVFQGNQWRPGMGGSAKNWHRITSNLIKANIDSLRPQLYFQNPKVSVQLKNPYTAPEDIPEVTYQLDPATGKLSEVPVMETAVDPQTGQPVSKPKVKFPKGTPLAQIDGEWVDAQEQVDLIEAVDNYYLGEMGAKRKVRKIINDALVLPYGIGKLCWQIEVDEEKQPVVDDGTETTKKVTVSRITRQGPMLERIEPWCFIFDPELNELDFSKARWVGEIKYMSREELEADPQLENLKDLGDPKYSIEGAEGMAFEEGVPDDMKRYKVYEIHDLKNSKLIVWVDGAKDFQRYEDNPYSVVEESVYTPLCFDETVDSPFVTPLPEQLRSKQEAYNFTLSYQLNHIARFNRKYRVRKGFNTDEREKLEKGADGTVIEVEDMSEGPVPIEDAPISSDIYNVQRILKGEMTEEAGVSAMNRARREPGVDTAHEAQLIQSGADIKVDEKRDIVREFMRSVVRKLNQILRVYVDEDTAIRISGPRGVHWRSWSREDIQGEFIEDVDIYSGMPFSREVEKRQAMEMFSLIQQDQFFDPYEVRAELRRKMDWPEKILRSPEEVGKAMGASEQAEREALSQAGSGQSSQLRPTDGSVRRASDIQGDMQGGRVY